MSLRIQQAVAREDLHVQETVSRKTPRPPSTSFGVSLRAGAGVVLRGVEIGAAAVAGPIVGAAIRSARVSVEGAAGGASETSTLTEVRAMQEQAQAFNLEYLALQEEVQQENRRFSTISNVLKAKHETAKSAIGNIRS